MGNTMFDLDLLNKFRDVVNNNIIRKKYRNIDGKNKWNIMCSAMDWIEVSANGIPKIELKHTPFASYSTSLNLMQYVMAIDSMVESFIQLYRVVWNKDDYPLKTDKTIFKHAELTDDKYFKHIRAAFGAHPVNLTSHDGRPKDKKNKERWYASWSTGNFFNKDVFEVRLYSNISKKDDDYQLKISISKLNEYVVKRYKLINDLTKSLEREVKQHFNEALIRKIESSSNHLKQLEILIRENEERFPFGGAYAWELSQIKDFLNKDTTVCIDKSTEENIMQYKKVLIYRIPFIKANLEQLIFDSRDYSYIFTPARHTLDNEDKETIHEYRYIIREIYKYFDISGREDEKAIMDIEEMIRRRMIPPNILETNSKLEQKLLFNASFYHRNKEKGIFE